MREGFPSLGIDMQKKFPGYAIMMDLKQCAAIPESTGKFGSPRRSPLAGLLRSVLFLALVPSAAHALVTSDGEGTHVVEPGVPAFGVNLDGVVFVGFEAFPGLGGGTGALISDTHVLTAGHVVASGPFLLSVRFDLADGPVWIPVKGYAVHPDYEVGKLDADLAIIELQSPAPAEVPRYELHAQPNEVGKAFVISGYGRTGIGATGDTINDGLKRAGLNRYEATGAQITAAFGDTEGYDPAAIPDDNLYFDFDSGLPANDLGSVLTGTEDLGFGDDEVMVAPGDSGGPSFIEGDDGIFRIAGVTATRNVADLFPDFDYDDVPLNSSWGEYGGVARVSTNLDFINDATSGNIRTQRVFDDGDSHVVDDQGADLGPIRVQDSPASTPTTVILEDVNARDLTEEGFEVGGSSLAEMQGGFIEGYPAARVRENGRFEMSGGTLKAQPSPPDSFFDISWAIFAVDHAVVRISGGTVEGATRGLSATQATQVFISDGAFTGAERALSSSGTTTIAGGSFSSQGVGVEASGSGLMNIRGGTFTGEEVDVQSEGGSEIRIFGSGFNLPVGEVAATSGTISGTYFDGTPFSFSFSRLDDSVIKLVSGYQGWAAFHELADDDALVTADANGNGLPNGLELVFGGNPAATGFPANRQEASVVTEDIGNGDIEYLKVSFPVTQLSLDLGAVVVSEFGTDLAVDSWSVAQHGVDGAVILQTPDGYAPGIHRREVWLPKTLAPGGRLFTRLRAEFP